MVKSSNLKILPKSRSLDDVASQAIELAKDQTSLEVGDLVSEYQKKWLEQMEEIVASHKTYADKYYILQWIQKEYGFINLLRNKCFVRRTRPDPDWNTDCYSYDNRSQEFKVEWTLPPKESATTILNNPERYHPFLVSSIKKFRDGVLQNAQDSPPDSSAQ